MTYFERLTLPRRHARVSGNFAGSISMSKGRLLRQRIEERGLVEAMAAHSPLSARLAEEAGFDAVWASGFEFSALHAMPDMSLVTMTQHLDMLRAMAERTSVPIVADLDTGFGNAINVIDAVARYERAGAAAVVLEDKSFPKVTSLLAEGRQQLLRVEEFQGKIEAALAVRRDQDLLVIARTEALIAGAGETEALKRAAAYEEAGAHMILVHSKQKTPVEIESFVRAWQGGAPLVLVPTAYPELTVPRIRALGKVRMVIYGNHAIRAAVAAMQRIFARIRADQGIHTVEAEIAPVAEIFRLQGMDEVKAQEARFLR
jgi:phosphoenolpyruvate phosphomutase